jgi:hypothetical protein
MAVTCLSQRAGAAMPIHDWTRVDAGLFHAFHQRWISSITDALNAGVLPPDYFALPEQVAAGVEPDALALRLRGNGDDTGNGGGGVAVAAAPPRTRLIQQTEAERYLTKVDRIAVRHRHGSVVAVVEIVSPGNKASRAALRAFVQKTADFIQLGIHVLVIDLFPPTRRDPQGIHKAIWDEFQEEDIALPPDKPLTLAAYAATPIKTAYVEPIAVGDRLPDMPLFLQPGFYVNAPLEGTYETTWGVFPAALKGLLQ